MEADASRMGSALRHAGKRGTCRPALSQPWLDCRLALAAVDDQGRHTERSGRVAVVGAAHARAVEDGVPPKLASDDALLAQAVHSSERAAREETW